MTDGLCQLVVPDAAIDDAAARLARFAPFIRRRFPETEPTGGPIESPLEDIPRMQQALEREYHCTIPGRLMLKMDSHLAIAASVKARGGIYEVLKHAEDLAVAAGKLALTDDYARLDSEEMRAFFRQYTVQVGFYRKPGHVDRHYERGAGLPGEGAHVRRGQAVEEGPAAQPRGGRRRNTAATIPERWPRAGPTRTRTP